MERVRGSLEGDPLARSAGAPAVGGVSCEPYSGFGNPGEFGKLDECYIASDLIEGVEQSLLGAASALDGADALLEARLATR